MPPNSKTTKYKWEFPNRFRAKAYSWKGSALAGKRIAEAIKELSKVAKTNPEVAGEGIVLFFEKLVPAIEQIDSSSGSIGNATNKAVERLSLLFKSLPLEIPLRKALLERIFQAFQEDGYGYLDEIGEYWGDLCGIPEIAKEWAETLLPTLVLVWSQGKRGEYFQGSFACLSALLAAGQHRELMEVLEKAPYLSWGFRIFGVKALVAMGKADEAIAYAKASIGLNDSVHSMSALCEETLISQGKWKEAYEEFGLYADWSGSYLQRFRSLAKQYPQLPKSQILENLVNTSIPEDQGKWFATAKEIGDLELALSLCTYHTCEPTTLNRAAKDYQESNPEFALGVAMASLNWISKGYGYELTWSDIRQPVEIGLAAGQALGKREEVRETFKKLAMTSPQVWAIVKALLS